MTAEVALLNKTAVALAADSAMTLAGPGKTYPAQKLFALTKHHPVGVMVYNNAEFMGIPWETLIKMYRRELDGKSRPTIKAYVNDFLKFIAASRFVTPAQETENLLRIAADLFRAVAERAADSDVPIQKSVKHYRNLFKGRKRSRSMTGVDVAGVLAGCVTELNELVADIFSEDDVTPQMRQSLVQLVGELIKSDAPTPSRSGIVIAGFGQREFFPTLIAVTVEGVVGGKVKYDRRFAVDIARDGDPATIIPFAQGEMVNRFMEGTDPAFVQYLRETMGEASTQVVIEVLKGLDVDCTEDLEKVVREAAHDQTAHYLEEVARFRQREFVTPIMQIVQHLPKEELADMAEALVSLTALKRRVSLEEETVGGPIDVAVISKGDGLIWIRRKHYFDPTLNQSYLTNHH